MRSRETVFEQVPLEVVEMILRDAGVQAGKPDGPAAPAVPPAREARTKIHANKRTARARG